MRTLIAACFLVMLSKGTVATQGKTDPTLNKLASEFAAAFNAGDAGKVAGFYADDAVLMAPNAPALKGKAAIQAYFDGLFKQGITDLRRSPIESATIERQHAFEAGTSSVRVRPANSPGQPPTAVGDGARSQGKYVTVRKSIRGEWKIVYDIFNDDQPTAGR